ncbi:MAG: bifunctional (p)ppGpp synthetase/guanosine-3',5'-bis(diphosphate) 3'-pyrophosphohydrolase [Phycisphaeraceae bacterium]|nr:bifunctional (p)ppGpp synthetase/guanosine-3',5'-bis(diphosphate) 3'-pyrophosphohydrolase [Phycisphaeraceae bacterium]QYK48036.1 MAG: bifunctional (p)ppGpp synthetase/guanosine-3',5'-bis(diphosphate) 3'-pyrophosphohydrolase [Phycisphaeraceae bacterium]
MSSPMWIEAVSYAARAHRHGMRKDGRTPYVAHVFRVAMTVRDTFGCDDPIAITAALLHDTIEDTSTDYDDIEETFGHDVAECVSALTKNAALPEHERESDYDRRLSLGPWQARLIKLADTHDNYLDMSTNARPSIEKARARCERAILLARPDVNDHPEVAWAIEIVGQLIADG